MRASIDLDSKTFLSSLGRALTRVDQKTQRNHIAVAEDSARAAQRAAPFERIARSIHVVHQPSTHGIDCEVVADDWIASFWELGTRNNPPIGFMRRGIAEGSVHAAAIYRRF